MKNKGFTLVELAIVLVIIGLLVGGVLQGQELIKQAQIRNTVQQLTSYDAAVNTFRAKYREMPGDVSRANTFGINVPKGTAVANVALTKDAENDGDGDGILDGDDGAGADDFVGFDGEIANFWVHLSNVNLVKGEYANSATTTVTTVIDAYPEASVGVGIVALTDGGLLYYVSGVNSIIATLAADVANDQLTPEEAYGIDSKIDDGKPDAGIIQAVTTYTVAGAFTDDADVTGDADDCMDADSEYNLAIGEGRSCSIRIRSSS